MGVIYKLQPETRAFILDKKKISPKLSCRKLAKLIEEELKIKVSKSSINKVFKEAGLSLPRARKNIIGGRPAKSSIIGLLRAQIESSAEAAPSPPPPPPPPPPPLPSLPPVVVEPESPVSIPEPAQIVQSETETKVMPAPILEGETTGAILLKAVDYIIGGLYRINDLIRIELGLTNANLLPKTEALAYARLFDYPPYSSLAEDCPVWTLIQRKLVTEDISAYLGDLQKNKTLSAQIYQSMPALLKEARGIKIVLSSGTYFYLDSQLHTIWSTPHIPFDFSATTYKIKTYINKYFRANTPLVFFMAPGYDLPINEFFEFILSLDSPEQKSITALSLYGNRFEDLDVFKLEKAQKRHFIFGLWPWQFVQYRKVNKIKEFKPFHFEPLKREFYIAEVEMELLQNSTNKGVTLRGAALKTSLAEKTRLIILSNFSAEGLNSEEICRLYLNQWPNLDEAFQDYSRKIELFTYTAGSQRIFSSSEIEKFKEPVLDMDSIFNIYLKMLDLYLRWYFMPSGYENKDFSTMKAQFYSLKAKIKPENDYLLVSFEAPAQPALFNDLEYTLRRLNEKEVISPGGKRFWFVCLKPVSS